MNTDFRKKIKNSSQVIDMWTQDTPSLATCQSYLLHAFVEMLQSAVSRKNLWFNIEN